MGAWLICFNGLGASDSSSPDTGAWLIEVCRTGGNAGASIA